MPSVCRFRCRPRRPPPPAPKGNQRARKHGGHAQRALERYERQARADLQEELAANAPVRENGDLPAADRAAIEFRGMPPSARDELVRELGDKITVHMWDARIPGGHALEARETDLTTGKSGFMIASPARARSACADGSCRDSAR